MLKSEYQLPVIEPSKRVYEMKSSRINLTLLRELHTTTKPVRGLMDSLGEADGPLLSRRSMLKLSGIAAVGSTSVLRHAGSFLFGPFDIQQSPHAVSILYAGQQRWHIDAKNYAGKPRIEVERTDSFLRIRLADAHYAGTDIPADFVCEIKPGLGSWRMHFHASFGGFVASTVFEQWLLGLQELRCHVDLAQTVCTPDDSHSLRFGAKAVLAYRPDCSWSIQGTRVAELRPWNLHSHRVVIRPNESHCFVDGAGTRRTRIVLERDSEVWNVDTNALPRSHWNLYHDESVFEQCIIDCTENASSRRQTALVFQSSSDESLVAMQPVANPHSTHDCTLNLKRPRYAILFSASAKRTCFMADFGDNGEWLHQGTMSYLLGARENTKPFELHSVDGRISRVTCQPSILKVMPHVGDVIASPVEICDDIAMHFSGFGAIASFKEQKEKFQQVTNNFEVSSEFGGIQNIQDDVYQLTKGNTKGMQIAKLGPQNIAVKTDLGLDSLSIIRPQDLLVLTFYYDNFSIRSDVSGSALVPTDSSKQGTIVVEFQPQNIIEQAFFEADNKLSKTSKYDPKTDTESTSSTGSTTEDLPQPPIKARMSGKSRLAFRVPKGTSLEISLDQLLKWEQWTPALVPVANRQDSSASSGFTLYTGLLSYLAKQGLKFKAGSFMNEISEAGSGITMSKLEASLNSSGNSILKSSGIEFNSSYSSSHGISSRSYSSKNIRGSKSSATSAKSSSAFRFSYNYGALSSAYNAGFALVKPAIREPEDTETALEIPYRLMLSPLNNGGWAHSRTEKTRSMMLKRTDPDGTEHNETVDFTELWHTRLWFRTKNKDGSYSVNERDGNALLSRKPKLRAIWSPDFLSDTTPPTQNWPPWSLSSLTSGDRWALVINSSDFYTKTTDPDTHKTIDYDPKAIDSDKLFLSSIGAWIDVHGAWDPVPSNVDLVDWIHRGTMGREHYVRVMYRGYLFPFGHKATLVKITERKFGKPPARGTYGAYMRQRVFIIVRQPDMVLDDTNTLFAHEGREFPFKKVRIKTVVTPNIENPSDGASSVGASSVPYGYPNEFYIRVSGEDFKFHCTGTDWDGNETDFVIPMGFVFGSVSNTNPAEAQKIVNYLNSLSDSSERKRIELHGKRVAFGPSKTKGDTTFETTSMVLNSSHPGTLPTDVTWFFPIMKSAEIRHQDVERMSGASAKPTISFIDKFLEAGFDPAQNAGEAFVQFASQVAMTFGGSGGGSSDKSGGFVSPNQAISGLSRAIGPISGQLGKTTEAIDKFADSSFNFDPKDFLGALDAKIFGVISLFDIIQLVTGSDPRTTLLPQLLSKVVPGLGNPADLLNTLKNSVMKPVNDAYASALADATATSSSILAKLQEMKDLIDGLQSHVSALETALGSASGTGDIFTALTTTLPEFLNWIETNIGPLGVIPQDALDAIHEVAKVLENMQNGIRIGFDWKPRMQADEFGFFVPQDPDDTFALSAYALIPLSNQDHSLEVGDPTAKVEGYLQNFSINLIPTVMDVVSLPIVKMGFSAEVGKKSDIFCTLGAMEWKGPLAFMNELQKFIPLDGFIDPPSIDVDMSGIKINFDLAIPTISVGVFAITNISLGAGLVLPFLGDSMLFKFDFCKKDSPFHVTYMMLGGGGYFGMTLSLDGIEKIEAAIEIGAELALDFGVASGSVSIFAGIYFSIEGDVVTLQGYVKIHGEVDVLGLISASITLEMTITYISTGKLYGTATLTIEIHLFVFSASVDITVEKYFKGSAGDPMIAQMVPDELYPGSSQKYFEIYVGAFA